MLSLTPPIPNPTLTHKLRRHHRRRLRPRCSSSFSKIPSTPPTSATPGDLYQPFRPPPSPLPAKYRSLDLGQRLDALRNRLGLWHEYAPLISSLSHDGFTPSSIEELTGISGVEQNRLTVAARVRDSLASTSPDLLPSFDHASAAELLYEIRLLNASQRSASARYLVERGLYDSRPAQDVARAVKDFPRRRGDDGWDRFSGESPADCLAYTHFRLSREAIDTADKLAELEKAMEIVETEEARIRIEQEMERLSGKGEEAGEVEGSLVRARLPVVRLRYGEVAEAASVALLPASRAAEGRDGVRGAPERCRWEGEVGVVAAEKGWGRWVVLPGWPPVLGLGGEGGVAVEFADARALPRTVNRWGMEEGVVVVVDRKRKEIGGNEGRGDDGFYLVSNEEGELGVERGSKVVEGGGKEVLGAVVLVVRPPKDEEDDDQLSAEDWE